MYQYLPCKGSTIIWHSFLLRQAAKPSAESIALWAIIPRVKTLG